MVTLYGHNLFYLGEMVTAYFFPE